MRMGKSWSCLASSCAPACAQPTDCLAWPRLTQAPWLTRNGSRLRSGLLLVQLGLGHVKTRLYEDQMVQAESNWFGLVHVCSIWLGPV